MNDDLLSVFDENIEQVEKQYENNLISEETMLEHIEEQEHFKNMTHQENSYIGKLGKVIEPVVKP